MLLETNMFIVHIPQTSVPPAQPHVPQPVQQCGQLTQVGDHKNRQLVSFYRIDSIH